MASVGAGKPITELRRITPIFCDLRPLPLVPIRQEGFPTRDLRTGQRSVSNHYDSENDALEEPV